MLHFMYYRIYSQHHIMREKVLVDKKNDTLEAWIVPFYIIVTNYSYQIRACIRRTLYYLTFLQYTYFRIDYCTSSRY